MAVVDVLHLAAATPAAASAFRRRGARQSDLWLRNEFACSFEPGLATCRDGWFRAGSFCSEYSFDMATARQDNRASIESKGAALCEPPSSLSACAFLSSLPRAFSS